MVRIFSDYVCGDLFSNKNLVYFVGTCNYPLRFNGDQCYFRKVFFLIKALSH